MRSSCRPMKTTSQRFLKALPPFVNVTLLGVGSNVIVRDGGIEGVVIRLAGPGFSKIDFNGQTVTAGAGVPDQVLARKCADAGLSGLEFFSGIPGTIGGALVMNAGCYDSETRDVLVSATGIHRNGERETFEASDFRYGYRTSHLPSDIVLTSAVFKGTKSEPHLIRQQITAFKERREAAQPIRERTGGSTFANPDPPGTPNQRKAWKLIDAAGLRGYRIGGAQVSEKHCNFLINTGDATADDLIRLGEHVRDRVMSTAHVDLHWEVRRIGRR